MLLAGVIASRPDVEASARVVLPAPEPASTVPHRLLAPVPTDDAGDVFVEVLDFDVTIHADPQRSTWGVGMLRRGTVVPATRRWVSKGCAGVWAELQGGGGVCDGDGVTVSDAPAAPAGRTLSPDLAVALPYRYAKISGPGVARLGRLPTRAEARRLARGDMPADLPHEATSGVVFVALDRPYEVGGISYHRTLDGDYVAEDDLVEVEPPATVGQPLFEAALPIAFVWVDGAPVHEKTSTGMRVTGIAERTARFEVARTIEHEGETWVELADGSLMRRADVRLAEAIAAPAEIEPDERWIHIDLDEQLLVAYEGEAPVYVTLVSSGKDGYDTPAGSYRIRRKYISRRMRGPDPDAGTYDIAEVPWAMYYHRGYALHGAYWHDEFGQVRSHGCTNLPPEAARWLFRWTAPDVPEGWHGRFAAGTRVVLTRDE